MSVSGDPHIQIEGLGKEYGGRPVFEDVSINIAEREMVTIVGPSGCGKTTLLRCIQGLVKPDSGRVLVDGKEVNGPPDDTAMVFQHFGLFPWKTVRANL